MEPEIQNNEAPLEGGADLNSSITPQTPSATPKIYGDLKPSAPPVVAAMPTPPPVTPKPVGIDLEKILLPTKEVHTSASAQRVSAGVLFAQEKTATLVPSAPTQLPPIVGVETVVPDKFAVQSLETFQGDVARVVQEKNTTVISAAAAESDRHYHGMRIEAGTAVKTTTQQLITRTGLVVGGALLLVAAGGLLTYIYVLRPTSVAVQHIPPAPFILVDDSVRVPIVSDHQDRAAVMRALNTAKNQVALALGLVARIEPVRTLTANDPAPATMSAHDLLQILSPNIPPALLRSVQPTFLLGVHSATNNQPFLILKVDSYEQSFSGMLAWEDSMRSDFAPLFTYTPRERIPEEQVGTTTPAQQFLISEFVDKIVENHDARVAQNAAGDMFFLWTFLDRNTIVVTTNSYTLREIISRLKDAPTL